MQKNNFAAILPATRCTEDMRKDVELVASVAQVDKADVIRDALAAFLPSAKLELGLIELAELDDETLAALGVVREPETQTLPAIPAGCWGGDVAR